MGVIDVTVPAKIVPARCVACCKLGGSREGGEVRV